MDELKNRLIELSRRSLIKNIYVYSSFLSESEQAELSLIEPYLHCNYSSFGGYDGSQRNMLQFGEEYSSGEPNYPLAIIEIKPLQDKFAENITHRDYLGAIMNLGIAREKLGDILVDGKHCHVIAESKIAEYIAEKLSKIRHNNVKCTIIDSLPTAYLPKTEERKLPVTTPRIDSVIARLYNLSREQSNELFRQKRVFVNGAVTENNSKMLAENEVISVRGFGKFIYQGTAGMSRKGKSYVVINVYI